MYLENPEGTQVIIGSMIMYMGYDDENNDRLLCDRNCNTAW